MHSADQITVELDSGLKVAVKQKVSAATAGGNGGSRAPATRVAPQPCGPANSTMCKPPGGLPSPLPARHPLLHSQPRDIPASRMGVGACLWEGELLLAAYLGK
jgi:hypothetical protein